MLSEHEYYALVLAKIYIQQRQCTIWQPIRTDYKREHNTPVQRSGIFLLRTIRLSKSLGIFQSRRDRDFDQISRRDYRDFETFKKSKKAQNYLV